MKKVRDKKLSLSESATEARSLKYDLSRTKLLFSLDYIFGRGTCRRLDFSRLLFEYSKRTGRLHQVVDANSRIVLFSFRPNGSIAPTIQGARLLLPEVIRSIAKSKLRRRYDRPRWTVTVTDGVSDFVSKGKTVFCKHVVACDDSLRAADDVAILNESGKLLAVGRAILAGPPMKQFKRGVAVKVRQGADTR